MRHFSSKDAIKSPLPPLNYECFLLFFVLFRGKTEYVFVLTVNQTKEAVNSVDKTIN